MPSVVAMSRGGSGTPSSPLLPLLLPPPGPHNKAVAAAGRAASARTPPPPRNRLRLSLLSAPRGPGADGADGLRRAVLGGAGAGLRARPLPPPPALLSEGTRSWGRRRHSSARGGGGGGEEETRGGASGAGRGRWAGPVRARAGCPGRRGARPGVGLGAAVRAGVLGCRRCHAELEEGVDKGAGCWRGALCRQEGLSVWPT